MYRHLAKKRNKQWQLSLDFIIEEKQDITLLRNTSAQHAEEKRITNKQRAYANIQINVRHDMRNSSIRSVWPKGCLSCSALIERKTMLLLMSQHHLFICCQSQNNLLVFKGGKLKPSHSVAETNVARTWTVITLFLTLFWPVGSSEQ